MIRCLSPLPFILPALILGIAASILTSGCDQNDRNKQAEKALKKDNLHRFIVIDPGHFHAALVFKLPGYDGISEECSIYAPVGEDFTDHMARVIPFNSRKDNPARWTYHVYLGPDFFETMLKEQSGDIAVISGRNNEKIERILACLNNSINVLGDKPWVIDPAKYPLLETALNTADEKKIAAYDMMTERYEITSILQRLIVSHTPVFGTLTEGTPDYPAIIKSSVHHLSKVVAGSPLKRPWWFFDTSIQGDGLVDIMTHLVDLVFWILYPDQPIYRTTDIEVLSAKRWPTVLTIDQYKKVTQKSEFPEHFSLDAKGKYPYFCNGNITFRVKGVHARTEVIWNFEAPEGAGDTHYSIIKGSQAHILVLQGKEQNYLPELYIEQAPGADRNTLGAALSAFIDSLAAGDYPGLILIEEKGRWRINIPDKYRVGHEAHFGQFTDAFLSYVKGKPVPAWEKANMLAKYFVTTRGLELARQGK